MRLEGKTALVTGASRNIGRAIAVTLAREGADVFVAGNNSTRDLEETATECANLGVQAKPLYADVSKSVEVDKMIQQALDHAGKVDILISTTGLRPHRPFWEVTDEEWHQVLAVNLDSTFYLARALAPSMIDRKSGSIVALGGMSTITGGTNRAAVAASKAGLTGLIRSLATELGPHGIRANQVLPGLIDTERAHPEWYPGGQPYLMRPGENESATPLGRMGTPEEVANACLFLASDESSYVTGHSLICAGGFRM
jgi:3-oxoacyl-[acyl-carrier protein] reductase